MRDPKHVGTLPASAGGAPARGAIAPDGTYPPLAEYGGSEDQAEELEAARIEETERLEREVERLRGEVEIERAGRELAERLADRRAKEIHRLEAELAQERRGFREQYSREGEG